MSQAIRRVATDQAPAALGAYSQAVEAQGFIFLSGQLGIDPATGELVSEDVKDQARQALANLEAVLNEAGSDVDHVVRTTIYLHDVQDFAAVNDVYAQVFSCEVKPARVALGGNDNPKGALVEIDAIAMKTA